MTPRSRPGRIEVDLADAPYPVVVGDGWLDALTSHVPLAADVRRALVVSQPPVVEAGHVAVVEDGLREEGIEVVREVLDDGEDAKDLAGLAQLWQAAAQAPLARDDLIVAVGGGVVGDLAGFAAATYNRGIAVLQVPTTLLAQVDAAIGGKTGVNLPQGKNLVGAFHQPVAVACDVGVLTTLPERLLTEGLAEVVKYGLIADPRLLDTLEAVSAGDEPLDATLLDEVVSRSAAVKAAVVADDEHERGQRAYLNLGHTYGHAVEALTGYTEVLHGEAVAIGTMVALRLGERLGYTPPTLVQRTERLLAGLGLPVRGPVLDRAEVWQVMGRDKKVSAGQVRFVVLEGLAAPRVVVPDVDEVDAVLDGLAAD